MGHSEPIELDDIAEKVKRYENLQPHLQNLNSQQWKLLEGVLNDYIAGNITEDHLGDQLQTILIPNNSLVDTKDEKKQNLRSCVNHKIIGANESFNENNSIDEEDLECGTNIYTLDETTNLLAYTSQMHYTERYSNYSQYTENTTIFSDTTTDSLSTNISVHTSLKEVAVPLIIDLIKTYKEEKLAPTTIPHLNESFPTSTDISKRPLKREGDKNDLIDIISLLTLIANLTTVLKPKPLLRDSGEGTAPLCPYTMMSFGTSPRYTKPSYFYDERNKTGKLVTLCYVCGLEENKIPQNSLCEDAFSRDDFSLREYTYKFKKYCQYDEFINNYCVHSRDKRSVWGHWTGGCSMRRIDISGVYTQRTCRNREWPTRGHHFASHRMARLEYILDDVEDGCTVSPTASLVPLSRSISLYARFIACVCPGALCNKSVSNLTFSYLNLFVVLYNIVTSNGFECV
ncbi:uncharacterized protein [Battus philenor]|uniref:uncharacterized protein n=1 Tax=Battus philenor TaxID=42288 RepID=UPI0035D05F35